MVNIVITTMEKMDHTLQKSGYMNLKLWTELVATTRKIVKKNLSDIFQKVTFASFSPATPQRLLQLPQSFLSLIHI